MATIIHPTAIIEEGAQIGENVSIGPFSIIGSDVQLGDGNQVDSHVIINGHTSIDEGNHFFPHCAIGGAPQSITYKGEPTKVEIGKNNIFRESITVNRGSPDDQGVTRIADDNFFMAYSHVAHDCQLGSNITFANCACLGGHVEVGDHVVLGGYTLVHQFCRIGAHCFTAGASICIQDVPPYMLVAGNRAITHGINVRGLRRRGFTSDDVSDLKRAYKIVYRSGHTLKVAIEEVKEANFSSEHIQFFIEFIQNSKRGVIR